MRDLIEVDLEKMSGTTCFTGTRVPAAHLFDYLEAGDTLDEFHRLSHCYSRTGAWRPRANAQPHPH